MALDRTAVKQLNKRVYHGLYSEVAKDTGMTRSAVLNVLNGRWYNQEIIDAALRRIEAREREAKSIAKRIAKLK